MDGRNKDEAREKVPVTIKKAEREMARDLPEYDGGYDAWRRDTQLPRRWSVQA